MTEIHLRGDLYDNDSADVLRWWGWRDITAPMDIAAALKDANGDDVTILVNSYGGALDVGSEIRSMLRLYPGKTTALIQGAAASAATVAISACTSIQCENCAILCYHNPSSTAEGDFRDMAMASKGLKNARDGIIDAYMARPGCRATREELVALMDKDIFITAKQAMEYGLIDEIVGLESEVTDPAAFVAAAGGRIRLTAAMRDKYRDHVAQEKIERANREKAERALAHIRTLANY